MCGACVARKSQYTPRNLTHHVDFTRFFKELIEDAGSPGPPAKSPDRASKRNSSWGRELRAGEGRGPAAVRRPGAGRPYRLAASVFRFFRATDALPRSTVRTSQSRQKARADFFGAGQRWVTNARPFVAEIRCAIPVRTTILPIAGLERMLTKLVSDALFLTSAVQYLPSAVPELRMEHQRSWRRKREL